MRRGKSEKSVMKMDKRAKMTIKYGNGHDEINHHYLQGKSYNSSEMA